MFIVNGVGMSTESQAAYLHVRLVGVQLRRLSCLNATIGSEMVHSEIATYVATGAKGSMGQTSEGLLVVEE